jgi:hypothetical protein
MGGACSTFGEKRGVYWDIGGNLKERVRTLGKPGCRRKDNIKMGLHEVGRGDIRVDRAGLG